MRRAVVLVGTLLLADCSSPAAEPPSVVLSGDRCALQGIVVPGPGEAALCAEAFVAKQGYTSAAVTDTVGLRAEFIEPGGSRVATLANRHGMLPSAATWVCRLDNAFQVVFPYLPSHPYAAPRFLAKGFDAGAPVDTLRGPWARLVRLKADLTGIEMRHSEFPSADSVWTRLGCVRRPALR